MRKPAPKLSTSHDVAHRGYLIRQNGITGDLWIEKDKFVIVRWVESVAHAKKQIDELLREEL